MVCTAEILSLAGFSLVHALLPQFMTLWSLWVADDPLLAGEIKRAQAKAGS
jgi:hypothetical protein